MEVREDLEYRAAASALLESYEGGPEQVALEYPCLPGSLSPHADVGDTVVAQAAAFDVHQAVLSDLNYRHPISPSVDDFRSADI
jgi:hypothetical protein